MTILIVTPKEWEGRTVVDKLKGFLTRLGHKVQLALTSAASPTLNTGKNTFLIGHETGVSKYTYNPNSLTDYLPAVSASFIKYEPLSNLVILSQANTVKFYSYSNASLVNSVTVSSEIKSLSLLYNK